jgi:hypothetical protein
MSTPHRDLETKKYCAGAEPTCRRASRCSAARATAETLVSRAFRDARLQRIGGGTDEIMNEVIAKRILQLGETRETAHERHWSAEPPDLQRHAAATNAHPRPVSQPRRVSTGPAVARSRGTTCRLGGDQLRIPAPNHIGLRLAVAGIVAGRSVLPVGAASSLCADRLTVEHRPGQSREQAQMADCRERTSRSGPTLLGYDNAAVDRVSRR